MYYIGITGANGKSGRVLAGLIGRALPFVMKKDREGYDELYDSWSVGSRDPEEARSTDLVIIDSFGEYILDQVRVLHGGLYGSTIDNTKGITLRDLTIHDVKDLEQFNQVTREEYIGQANAWMTLEEFSLYYADTVMKKAFGDNVWINLMNSWDSRETSSGALLTIYVDVKTQAEYDYIRNIRQGTIIRTSGSRSKYFRNIHHEDGDLSIDPNDIREGVWDVLTKLSDKFDI